jgi:hypothetical protein
MNGFKNLDGMDRVVDPFKPVQDSYGNPLQSPNTDINGNVLNPHESVFDGGDYGYDGSNSGLDLRLLLWIPGVAAVVLRYIFEFFIPLMELLFIPALVTVLFLTFYLPNYKSKLKRKGLVENRKRKYSDLMTLNAFCSFIVMSPYVIPPVLDWFDKIARTAIDNGVIDSFWPNFWFLVGAQVFTFAVFIFVMYLIPTVQWILWKYASKWFEIQFFQKLAEKKVKKI